MHIKLPYSEQSGHIPSADRLKVGELWINGADNIIGTKKQNEQVVQFAQLTPEQRERVLNDYIPKHGVVDKVSVGQTATKIEGKNDAVTIDINDDSDTAIEYTVTNSALTINIEKTTGHKATKLVISKPASQPVVITWNGVDHWLSTAGVPTFGESLELEELCVAIFTSSTINCVNVIYNTEAVGSTDDEAVWGMIGGSLSDQEDLQAALNSKLSVNVAAETYLKKTDKAESAKVADTVVGKNVTGVVAEATKATQDALGRVINTTYAEANATTATLATKVDKTQYNADKQTFALEETVTAELAKKVNQSAYDADKKTFATKSELATVKNESVSNTATNGSFDSVVDNTASADVSQFSARTTSSAVSSSIQTTATSTNAQFTIAAEQSASKMKVGGVAGIRFIGDLDAGVTIEQSSLAKPFVIRNDAGDITLTDKGGSLTLTQLQQLNKNALLKNDAAALYSTKTETSKAVGDLRTQVASTYQTKAEATTTKNQLTTSISTKADKTYVDNTLKSYATTKYVDEKVSTVYRYKGNVANKGSLPADNNVIGDVWNAEDTGKNYVWTGSEWDDIGGVVDLTPYLTKSDATATYLGKTAKAVSATTADKAAILSTARTIAISGDVTGSASFNGSANATIAATLANSGVDVGSYGQSSAATLTFGGSFIVPRVTFDAKGRATGATQYTVKLPAAPTSVTGNAGTATKLQTARTIAITGDATGTATAFDGSKNVTITATIPTMGAATASSAGTKGLVPAPDANKQGYYLRGDGTWAVPTNNRVGQYVMADNVEYPLLAKRTNAAVNTTDYSNFAAAVTLNPSLGQITAKTFKGALSGNAATASKAAALTTARTIAIGGAVTGTATSFNGTANITINTTAVNGAKVTGTVPAATKATQDGGGKDIAATYATKTEVTQGLAGKANISHTHTVSQITDMPKVVLSVNGQAPNADGNISPSQTGCLPLTGGTLTGGVGHSILDISETSGLVTLTANRIHKMNISGNTTFSLPAGNASVFTQIKVMVNVTGTPSINWGTSRFFNKKVPSIAEGQYDFYFDYDPTANAWVAGAVPKGVA